MCLHNVSTHLCSVSGGEGAVRILLGKLQVRITLPQEVLREVRKCEGQ